MSLKQTLPTYVCECDDHLSYGAAIPQSGQRLCPKCGKTRIKLEQDDPSGRVRLCPAHWGPMVLFCFNCAKGLCIDCLGGGPGGHHLHHVDNLAFLQREKLAMVEVWLTEMEQMVDDLRGVSALYARNLEVLENEEAVAFKRIEAIAASSTSKVTRMTSNRKTTLRNKLRLPEEKGQLLAQLRETVEQLPAEELMKQWTDIERNCMALREGCHSSKITLEKVDDFQCELIPAYKFEDIIYIKFRTAAIEEYGTYNIQSVHDISWTLTVIKLKIMQVKLVPADEDILDYPHKLIVIVLHTDATKEIRKRFDVDASNNTFGIANVADLEQFCKDGQLKIRVGIRPLDALVEKRLIGYQNEQLKAKQAKLQKQLDGLAEENAQLKSRQADVEERLASATGGFDYQYTTSHCILNMRSLPSATTQVTDEGGHIWDLSLRTNTFDGSIDAWIALRWGSGTNCQFFVQIKHPNPEKAIVMSKTVYFAAGQTGGWRNFVSWSTLSKDIGYCPFGNVCFRFGVKPLPM